MLLYFGRVGQGWLFKVPTTYCAIPRDPFVDHFIIGGGIVLLIHVVFSNYVVHGECEGFAGLNA